MKQDMTHKEYMQKLMAAVQCTLNDDVMLLLVTWQIW
jgi:hypothetical protein